ncbi:discoidin domain-containing protein [Hymenobacter cellulosilyticus]|uniref:Discoidin domain-containing protein n=1 Tax=Hymenobacter cellulosilyticus TaxID=2932248 RepID=A0A8T9QA35_9BACT|nr:discoidin domain-containing protein [Hymenobacter cellulosilyticus]UOQ74384.1 discoidin domain-containing protein [Hymenobacter cellulosilyticus]
MGAAPQWIYVDLGATYAVSRVKLLWEAAYATDYLVEISADAVTWSPLRAVTGNGSLTNDLTGLSGTGKFVRIYCQTRALPYGYSLYDFEVYGTAASGSRALVTTRAIAPEARLYPNPVSRLLKVPTASAGVLTITDALGRVAHTQAVTAQQAVAEVDVQSLRPGLYFLTLRDATGGSTVQQFIKQ